MHVLKPTECSLVEHTQASRSRYIVYSKNPKGPSCLCPCNTSHPFGKQDMCSKYAIEFGFSC